MESQQAECFFCTPDQRRIVQDLADFYTIVGLGPIVEGYIILASHAHIPSMLDLPDPIFYSFLRVRDSVRQMVRAIYGPCIVVEHGRIAACTFYDHLERDKHCYHAHHLIFPTDVDISEYLTGCGFTACQFETWQDARTFFPKQKEYLYFENAQGQQFFCDVPYRCPRQFLRLLVAQKINAPHKANWKTCPDWEMVWAAKRRYGAWSQG